MTWEAQKWLEENYSQKDIKKISVSENVWYTERMEGILDLSEYTNLEELIIQNQKLSGLNLSKCKNLSVLKVKSNNLTNLDLNNNLKLETIDFRNNEINANLDIFSNLTNLKYLDIENNDFEGSLQAFENCQQLESLNISNNKKITEGLEYLPTNLSKKKTPRWYQQTNFKDKLEPYDYDIEIWKLVNHPEKNVLSVKKMAKKIRVAHGKLSILKDNYTDNKERTRLLNEINDLENKKQEIVNDLSTEELNKLNPEDTKKINPLDALGWEYLDKYYPFEERKNIKEFDSSNNTYDVGSLGRRPTKLEGNLNLKDFVNLNKLILHISPNLINLDLSANNKLEEIEICGGTKFDLKIFSHLTNLKKLKLEVIKGSFKSLENCKKLEHLEIEGKTRTDIFSIPENEFDLHRAEISDGLEYLPLDNLKHFYHIRFYLPISMIRMPDYPLNGKLEAKDALGKILEPYGFDIYVWKLANHPNLINKDFKLLDKELDKKIGELEDYYNPKNWEGKKLPPNRLEILKDYQTQRLKKELGW